MPFAKGQIVRLTADRTYDGVLFQAGTLGTVVAPLPTMGSCLVLFGHDTTTRLAPESVLTAAASAPTVVAVAKATKAMRFTQNDRVRLREQRVYPDRTYPAGSPGFVQAVLSTLGSYLIDFDVDSTDRVLPDGALDPET